MGYPLLLLFASSYKGINFLKVSTEALKSTYFFSLALSRAPLASATFLVRSALNFNSSGVGRVGFTGSLGVGLRLLSALVALLRAFSASLMLTG